MRVSRIPQEKISIAGPVILVLLAVLAFGWVGNDLLLEYEDDAPSDARGSRVNGYLVNGKRLPTNGDNFETFSRFASSFGRTCVYDGVRDVMLDAYAAVYEKNPRYVFIYGETGWCDGGGFWPHRTHQHGLSVDFMVPVTQSERVVKTPATLFDGFGYYNEFEDDGTMGEYAIDYEAVALHLVELRNAASDHGLKIERVIFDEPFREALFKTKRGRKLRKQITWVERPVWVRHDDHYHVDFAIDPKKRERVVQKRKKEQEKDS